jgi:deaminated glutathione amidase
MKIALCQTRTGINATDNAHSLEAMVALAAQNGADIVFTPEMSGLLDRNRERSATQLASEDHDVVLAAMRAAAQRHGLWIALGSLAIADASDDGRLVNRSYMIDNHGVIRACYDKIHLFDVDLATGESWRESARYAPGDRAVVVTTPVGVIGLSICYDIRFPALYAALSDNGAQLLSIPAAFTVPTGEAHWHILLRARAIESGCFVIAAAQCGLHEDGRSTYGHSLVVDPWGRVLLDMGVTSGVGMAEIDLSAVATARAQLPVLDHRRPISHMLVQP